MPGFVQKSGSGPRRNRLSRDRLSTSVGRLLALVLLLWLTPSCSRRQLSIVVTPDSKGEAIARELAVLAREAGDFELELVEGEGSVRNLERVRRGKADLTIVENSVPFQGGVRTVVPLFPSVLHVLHEKGIAPQNFRELVEGKRVWLGARGGLSEWFVDLIRAEAGLSSDAYTIVESREVAPPDVVIVFGMLDAAVSDEIADHYEFYVIDRPEEIGRGSIVEGLSARFPQMPPYIIPKRFYGAGNPEPVATLRVDNFLVARADVPDVDIYDLARTVFEHKRALGAVSTLIVQTISGDFDQGTLTFPLHDGAREYLDRNEPGLLERYAELAGVSFTVFIACASGLLALARWRMRRRKGRIDRYYVSVMEARSAGLQAKSVEEVEAAMARLRRLQDEAFELLIKERLAADESFRIFVTLVQEAREQLKELQHDLATLNASSQ